MKIYNDSISLTGHTPLVALDHLCSQMNCGARIFAKLESHNPGGSIKDRVAIAMIEDAEKRGALRPGGTIIEPTSGNTGIGLAWAGRLKGYNVILTMPDTMSLERRNLLQAYGAQLILTPGTAGMKGAIEKAEQLHDEIPGSLILGQFDNPSNPAAHEHTTAPEIWYATGGDVDILVAGVGTGGTISGTGRGLKNRDSSIHVVAVEPSSSAVISGGKPGPHKIQGIGAGFVPGNYDPSVVDEVIAVDDDEAFKGVSLLARTEGLLAGISSGAALSAAVELACRPENKGKNIVVIMPDGGEKYMSMDDYRNALS